MSCRRDGSGQQLKRFVQKLALVALLKEVIILKRVFHFFARKMYTIMDLYLLTLNIFPMKFTN